MKARVFTLILLVGIVVLVGILCVLDGVLDDSIWRDSVAGNYEDHHAEENLKMIRDSAAAYLLSAEPLEKKMIEFGSETKAINVLINDYIKAPGDLFYGPYQGRGDHYSKKHPEVPIIYRINSEKSKSMIAASLCSFEWKIDLQKSLELEQKVGEITTLNEIGRLIVYNTDERSFLICTINDNDYSFVSEQKGCYDCIHDLIESRQIEDTKKVPYQSEDWEWFMLW